MKNNMFDRGSKKGGQFGRVRRSEPLWHVDGDSQPMLISPSGDLVSYDTAWDEICAAVKSQDFKVLSCWLKKSRFNQSVLMGGVSVGGFCCRQAADFDFAGAADAGVSFDIADSGGYPLCSAIDSSSYNTMISLLACGASPNPTRGGRVPLQAAIELNDAAAVSALLSFGADASSAIKDCSNFACYAEMLDNYEIADLINAHLCLAPENSDCEWLPDPIKLDDAVTA